MESIWRTAAAKAGKRRSFVASGLVASASTSGNIPSGSGTPQPKIGLKKRQDRRYIRGVLRRKCLRKVEGRTTAVIETVEFPNFRDR